MGRSMGENDQRINDIVEDRITLTIAISLGTIVFTWLIALPIGIYSAARQYSPSDHILTLIGFIGMCVPAFLFALVLTTWSGVSGLFSPEFAGAAGMELAEIHRPAQAHLDSHPRARRRWHGKHDPNHARQPAR